VRKQDGYRAAAIRADNLVTLLVVVDPFSVAPVASNRGRGTSTARRYMNSSGANLDLDYRVVSRLGSNHMMELQ